MRSYYKGNTDPEKYKGLFLLTYSRKCNSLNWIEARTVITKRRWVCLQGTGTRNKKRRRRKRRSRSSRPNLFRKKDKECKWPKRAWTKVFSTAPRPGTCYRRAWFFFCLVLPRQIQRFLEEPEKRTRTLRVGSLNYFQFFVADRTANRVYWLK